MSLTGKCGCGRDGRYMIGQYPNMVDSCNKYKRCPGYSEIYVELDEAKKRIFELEQELKLSDAVNGALLRKIVENES